MSVEVLIIYPVWNKRNVEFDGCFCAANLEKPRGEVEGVALGLARGTLETVLPNIGRQTAVAVTEGALPEKAALCRVDGTRAKQSGKRFADV
jgi:hypothetical protein